MVHLFRAFAFVANASMNVEIVCNCSPLLPSQYKVGSPAHRISCLGSGGIGNTEHQIGKHDIILWPEGKVPGDCCFGRYPTSIHQDSIGRTSLFDVKWNVEGLHPPSPTAGADFQGHIFDGCLPKLTFALLELIESKSECCPRWDGHRHLKWFRRRVFFIDCLPCPIVPSIHCP